MALHKSTQGVIWLHDSFPGSCHIGSMLLVLLIGLLSLLHDSLHDKCARVASISTAFDLEWHSYCRLSVFGRLHQIFSLLLPLAFLLKVVLFLLLCFLRFLVLNFFFALLILRGSFVI